MKESNTTTKHTEVTMSNNKQSSVEWLQETELQRDLTIADWNKAKAMHKEEIIEAMVKLALMQHLNNTTKKHTEVTMSNNKQSSVEWLVGECAYSDLRPELWEILQRNI